MVQNSIKKKIAAFVPQNMVFENCDVITVIKLVILLQLLHVIVPFLFPQKDFIS